jgi:signal peptidase I
LTAACLRVTARAMESVTPLDVARSRHRQTGEALAASLGSAVRLVALALVLALALRTFVVQPFAIPSGSMAPGLEAGDFIFVNKTAYGWSAASFPFPGAMTDGEPAGRLAARPVMAGDVIVFAGPDGQDYVKRVIARGGDRVGLVGGRVVLNGRALPCAPVAPALCRETLPSGDSHLVRGDGSGPRATWPEILVPQGHFFVLGDNRDASADSRVPRGAGGVGLVAEGEVLGRAERIFFSARDGVRWARIGQPID